MGSEVFATVGMLVVMVLVFVGAYWASKILAQHYQSGIGCSGNIKILERTAMGQNSWLVLVQVGKQVQLLGVTAKQITHLATFPQEEIQMPVGKELPVVSFKEILRNFREKGGDSGDTKANDN